MYFVFFNISCLLCFSLPLFFDVANFFFFKLVLKFSRNVILVTIEPPLVQMKNGKTRANRDSDPILHLSHLAGFLAVKIRVLSLERVVHTNFLIKKEKWGFHILGLSLVGQFTAV